MKNSTTLPLNDQLRRKIFAFAASIWDGKWDLGADERWLGNFLDNDIDIQERQRLNMLYLLSRFMYFGDKEVRQLLLSIFRDLYKYPIVEQIRRNNNDTLDLNLIDAKFAEELNATRFLGVGNPSESGVHLLYYFRQECKLSKKNFINASEIFTTTTSFAKPGFIRFILAKLGLSLWPRPRTYVQLADQNIKRYVFIDDVCGSGSQASIYLGPVVGAIKAELPSAIIDYYMLFGTENGVRKVKSLKLFDSVEAVFTIDDSFKAFSHTSRYFDDLNQPGSEIEKAFARSTAATYGRNLFNHPLGFNDGQLLLGLFHNTPDNTLPIFWGESNGWVPAFKRYHKIY